MTVKYLQNMQRNHTNITGIQTDAAVLHKFKAGFSDCTNEVNRYIDQIDGIDRTVKERLLGHLDNCVTRIQQRSSPSTYKSFRSNLPNNLSPSRPLSDGFRNDGSEMFQSTVC